MKLYDDIRMQLAGIKNNNSVLLGDLPADYPAWIVKNNDRIGIMIPCKMNEAFNNSFADIKIVYYPEVTIDGEKQSVLFLYKKLIDTSLHAIIDTLSMICTDFAYPGPDGRKRHEIIDNPIQWWKNWKNLMGNKKSDTPSYSVLAELLTYKWLLKCGYSPVWTGKNKTRIDFDCGAEQYEVKSTVQKYSNQISINGQFQMKQKTYDNLYMVFFRMERTQEGITIDSVVNDLVYLGADKTELENHLFGLDLPAGNIYRREQYSLLEVRKLPINDKFPCIVPESFKDNKIPEGILSIHYDVDISNLKYENIIKDIL